MENNPDQQFDFVGIGDIVTDAFIRLKNAELHCDINHEHCEICMDFGAKIPYESVTTVPAVGNSPNATVAASRLGLRTALVTDLGDDYHGDEALATLTREKVDTRFVHRHPGQKTNYHYVLWYQDDRTILIKHEEYPYALPNLGSPRWIYLSSLGEHSLAYHGLIEKYLQKNPTVKLAFQPGTFQISLGPEKLKGIYARTEVFFCNREEAQKILNIETEEIKKLLSGLRELGPKIAVITDGVIGAYASDGEKIWFIPPYPDPAPPLERTGAGDAFSATVTAALALGEPFQTALAWGPINSMSVVQKVGAQAGLLTRKTLEQYLAQAPADYQPKTI
ncbi:MAG: carbohydrate kinase family protein [Candidatus Vogelbacteria bacterium]